MQNKIELRNLMKLSAVMKVTAEIIDAEVELAKKPYMWSVLCVKIAMLKQKLGGISNTKAELFRTDKPELDKRRVKRSMKGVVFASPFNKPNCEAISLDFTPENGIYEIKVGKNESK